LCKLGLVARKSSLISLRNRANALKRWSAEDAREGTRKARETWLNHWLDVVDPDGSLPERERARRAEAARRAWYATLAYRSALARASKKAGRS
jgi:hypothetical protein